MLSRANWHGEWMIVRRHPLLWVVIAGSLALVVLAAGNEAPQTSRELFESITRLSLAIPVLMMPFMAGSLAPVFFLREVDHGMSDLFAAYPQILRDWLMVRIGGFAAILIAVCAVQNLAIVGILANEQPQELGALALRAGELLVFVHMPACLIWACALARVSCAKGGASMVYLAAAFGWLSYVGLATLTDTPLISGSFLPWAPLRTAMMLADPYAITALVNPPPFDALAHSREIAIGLGRIMWLILCIMLVRGIRHVPANRPTFENVAHLAVRPGWRIPRLFARWPGHSYLALLLRWTLVDKFMLLALVGWAVLIFPEVYGGMGYVEQLSLLTPDSRDALNRVMWDMVPPTGALLMLYAADRTSRMSRIAGMDELTGATPRPFWRYLGAQLVCLSVLALMMLTLTLAIVLCGQVAAQSPVQPREYLEQAGQILPGLLLAAAAFIALHGMLRSRMLANLIGLALLVLGHSDLVPAMGFPHPLLRPLVLPIALPDHILGLTGNWAALAPVTLFWAALCATALLIAVRFDHRGLPYKQTSLRKAFLHPTMIVALLLLIGGVSKGSAIQRMLVSDLSLVRADERAQGRAQYERLYADWQNRPQPHVLSVESHVDLAADSSSADLRVIMRLINRSDAPIDRILVGRNIIDVDGHIVVDAAVQEVRDTANGQSVFRLAAPMRPGETGTLRFRARIARSALASTRSPLILRPQFAALPVHQILPVIGFRRELTMRDPVRRAEFDLPPLTLSPPSLLAEPGPDVQLSNHQATFETFLSAPSGRHAVAPGDLVRRWRADGRDHFHFRTDRAIRNIPAFFVVPWPPSHWQAGALAIDVYAPGSIAADNPNVLALRDTLTWLDRDVAPYPGRRLRLIAAPEFGSSGFALPQAMLISHRRGFRAHRAPDAGFDQVYRRAVHETAHQWFGHFFGYGLIEERAFLVESLAKYAELVMVERRYGTPAMQALVAWEADRLARARLAPEDVATPLIDAQDTEDMYSRATVAFACLRSQIGDAAMVGSLRQLATLSQQTGRPIRSLDFVRALEQAGGRQNARTIDRLLVSNLPIAQALLQSGCSYQDSN